MQNWSVPVRLAGFVVALVAVLGIGAGLGAAVGPDRATAEAPVLVDACVVTGDTEMEH